MTITTGLLIEHRETVEALVGLLEGEWPDWYNAHGASARSDLSERMRRDRLPLGIVAFVDDMLVGACALTLGSGGLVTERSPWLGGLVVAPDWRRQGVGKALLERTRSEARRLGYRRLHALTSSADGLFSSAGWTQSEALSVNGEPHRIFVTPS